MNGQEDEEGNEFLAKLSLHALSCSYLTPDLFLLLNYENRN